MPDKIELPVSMASPNDIIFIHRGKFKLISGEDELLVDGEITFEWFPKTGVKFSCTTIDLNDSLPILNSDSSISIVVNDNLLGSCSITAFTMFNSDGLVEIEGITNGLTVLGDKTISVNKIIFAIPNLRRLPGNTRIVNRGLNAERLTLTNEDFTITLDLVSNFEDRYKALEKKGGYILLYSGELTSRSGSLSSSGVSDLFKCFSHFLNFLNARRCYPLFRTGVFNYETLWCDYSSYLVDQHKYVRSWVPESTGEGLNTIWVVFYNLWKAHKDFLISAIHWYTEANAQSGFVDGAIIMAQTGLELIYNWLLVEQEKIIIGKDAESISASNKIRLLLSLLKVKNEVPSGLENLSRFVDSSKEVSDAPEALVQIRNSVVHSQASKRAKIAELDNIVLYEALQLGLWYIELSLLYIFKYNNKYINRCSALPRGFGTEESMPWLSKTAT